MDLNPVRTVATYDEKAWLGSTHGLDSTRTVTLDVAAFRASGHVGADGLIPSGTPIVKNDGTGLYVPAVTFAAGAWSQAGADMHLREQVKVAPGSTTAGGAGLWHGVVVTAQLPTPDVEGAADAPAFDAAANGATHVLYV